MAKIDEKLDDFCEFETKYEVDGSHEQKFKEIMMGLTETLGKYEFIYAEGPDVYYSDKKEENYFGRYRKAINQKASWWTLKRKPRDAKNNIKRKEVNWRVDNTPAEVIHEGALMQGFEYNFGIWKVCHIYKFKEACFVFYRVVPDYNKEQVDHFIEIELDEDTIGTLTEQQAHEKIKELELSLKPLGITYRNRLDKSLYERYRVEDAK